MKPSSRLLIILIAAHLALGLVYDWATPPLEASDEGFHYAVVHWLARGRGLPVQHVGAEMDWAQEGGQPPLYYWLAAGLTRWVDTSDYARVFVRNPLARAGVPGTPHNVNLFRHPLTAPPLTGTVLAVRLARWLSLLLSAFTIWLVWIMARQVFPGRPTLPLLAAALAAFNPMVLFINASVNNDNLLMLFSTLALVLTLHLMPARVARYGWSCAALGLVLGLAALTKVSGLVLWPLAALGVAWGAWRTRDGRRFVFGGAMILFLALAISGWWFARNGQLYGDPLGLKTMVAIAGPRPAGQTLPALIQNEWEGFWLSYWGVFGGFNVRASDWVYWIFNLLTLGALCGGAAALTRRRKPSAEQVLLALFCLLTLIGVVQWTRQTYASQGRLMFGALAPLSIFMAAGLLALVDRLAQPRARHWFAGLAILTLGLTAALVPLTDIAPRYAPPRPLRESDLPADLQAVQVQFGEGMELVGYTADDAPRQPGQSQTVTFYWRARAGMQNDYAVALHLLGRGAQEIGKIDTWPGGGRAATSLWQPGLLFADTYQLPLAAEAAAPSLTRLAVDVWDGAPTNHIAARGLDGTALASVSLNVGRVVPRHTPQFTPTLVEGSSFEHGIALLGLDSEPGRTPALTFYWKTAGPVPGDYTLFLHLLDAAGRQVAQADAPPLAGDWPTSAWVPGLAFADRHVFEPAAPLPPGRYALRFGFYDPASGARLSAFRAEGEEWPDDAVVIPDALTVQ